MEYTVEDISPVEKKITVNVAPDEVDAALAGALAVVRQNAQLDGFRKGKVPLGVVAKRFHDHIEKEARDNLINVHINDIVGKTGSQPVSAIKMTGDDAPLAKGQPFVYTMQFEVMPAFDLPPYEGLEVNEEEAGDLDAQVDRLIEKLRKDRAPLVPVDGNGPAQDGQVAVIDFEPYEDGKLIERLKTAGFSMRVGQGEALPEFENLVKSIPVGHTGEGEIKFPDDFLDPSLAGKTILMKVTVHAVKERNLPELNDDFAKSANYKDMEDMRQKMRQSVETIMGNLHKSAAEMELLKKLVKQTDFALPPSMVSMETSFLINDYAERMERMGKAPASTEEQYAKIKAALETRGEERAREKIVLLAIAKKENLEVDNQDLLREIFNASQKMGMDFKEYYGKLQDSGMIFKLRENMLCDKAMDLVYERAKVTKVPEKGVDNAAPEEALAGSGPEDEGTGKTDNA